MNKRGRQRGRRRGVRGGLGALLVVALGGLAAAVLSRGEWLLERLGGLGGPAGPASPGGLGAPPSDHLALGVPAWTGRGQRDPDDDHLMIKPQYALSYNRTRNGANWVSWHLSAAWFGDVPRHRGRFLVDEALPAGWYRAQHDDYTGSGYDRGHMVRSEERTRSVEDNKATFLMTNILPQQHDLNAGPWLRLEERCQHLAQKEGRDVHIVAGGLFGGRPDAIGKSIAVPEAFFKIIVVLDRGQAARGVGPAARVIAVIMPNESGMLDEGWGRYRTSVDAIEQRAGYDFLTAVPEPVQRAIEARVDDGPADPR